MILEYAEIMILAACHDLLKLKILVMQSKAWHAEEKESTKTFMEWGHHAHDGSRRYYTYLGSSTRY